MINILKGIIIGIGKIIPGVSGAMIAMTLGVYDKSIDYINNYKYKKKESIKYLLPIAIGIFLSIILFSKIINYTINRYYLYTMMLFIGLIISDIPKMSLNIKNSYITLISFIIMILISITNINNNYIVKNNYKDIIIFFLSGIAEAIGTIIPGISSSGLLLIIGTYNEIIKVMSNITNINIIVNNTKILIPFIMGLVLGVILCIKIIDKLLKKYKNKTYSLILGILLSTIILLIIKVFNYKYTILELIIGLIFLVIGILIPNIIKK